jgi:hypothetical protein
MIRKTIFFLLMLSPLPTAFAQAVPSYDEQREILLYLRELPLVRHERDILREGLTECRAQAEQWLDVYAQSRDGADALLSAKDREIQLYKERAEFYETAYKTLARKPGFFCRVKKALTLGIAKCG